MVSSHLLKLSAEIRQLIYENLLVSDIPLRITIYHPPAPYKSSGTDVELPNIQPLRRLSTRLTFEVRKHERPRFHPAVLQVCRQLYAEACPLLYSRNVFRFWNIGRTINILGEFIQLVGPQIAKVRHLIIDCGAQTHPVLAIRKYLPSLRLLLAATSEFKTIELHFDIEYQNFYDDAAKIVAHFDYFDAEIPSFCPVKEIIVTPSSDWRDLCRRKPGWPTFKVTLEPETKKGILALGWVIAE
jgi:hypothetical protein